METQEEDYKSIVHFQNGNLSKSNIILKRVSSNTTSGGGNKSFSHMYKISGGDTYTIIYLKLLLLSLKESGKLYYDGVEADFVKELALTIDETEDDVMVTFNYLF